MISDDLDAELLRAIETGQVPAEATPELVQAFGAQQRIDDLFNLLAQPVSQPEQLSQFQIGSRIGEFTLERRLGEGAMGTVFLAIQESLGRKVALKVCKPDVLRDSRLRERFLTEGRALAKLRHPNVVSVLLSGEFEGSLYLVMEYVQGPTIADLVHAIRSAPAQSSARTIVAEVLCDPHRYGKGESSSGGPAVIDRSYRTWMIEVLEKVATGLAEIHEAGIVHRDLKPANIVLDARGEPKIVDFGLARMNDRSTATVSGEFFGTPSYTSPEQARGAVTDISPASDVFSFGALFFECLSLRLPFDGESSAEVITSILTDEPPLLRRIDRKSPWELEAIADKCLRKNSKDRYPTAVSLSHDLRNYLNLRPISARRTTGLGRFGRLVRRRPWATAFVATLLVAVSLGALIGVRTRREFVQHQQAELERRYTELIDMGDSALFRILTAQRPTWSLDVPTSLPDECERTRREAIAAYSASLEIRPDAVWPLVQRGRLYTFEKESLPRALADFEKAHQLAPHYASICKHMAFCLQWMGREKDAERFVKKAEALYPQEADDLYWLGSLTGWQEQNSVDAYQQLSQCLLLEPNHYWARLERVSNAEDPGKHPDVMQEQRLEELRIAATLRPDLPFAAELVPYCLADKVEAARELERTIDIFGMTVPRAHHLARLLRDNGDSEKAARFLTAVLHEDPGGATASMLGDLKMEAREFDEAVTWYAQAIRKGYRVPIVYVSYAHAAEAAGDSTLAERVFAEGIHVHSEADQVGRAARIDEMSLANTKEDLRAYLHEEFASWYSRHGKYFEAERLFRNLCDSPTARPRSYLSYAKFLDDRHRYEDSIAILEKGRARCVAPFAEQSQPLTPIRMDLAKTEVSRLEAQLGNAYIRSGRIDDSIALVEQAKKRRPYNSSQAAMLVDLLKKLGKSQEALVVARSVEFAAMLARGHDDRTVDLELFSNGSMYEYVERAKTRLSWEGRVIDDDLILISNSFQNTPEAIAVVRDGIDQHPNSHMLYAELARLLLQTGEIDDASKNLDKALGLFFDDIRLTIDGRYDTEVGGPVYYTIRPVKFIRTCFALKYALQREDEVPILENRILNALGELRNCLRDEWQTYSLQGKGEVAFFEKRILDVFGELHNGVSGNRLIALFEESDRIDVLMARARAELDAGNFALAAKSLTSCWELEKGRPAPWVLEELGACFAQMDSFDDAIHWYRLALEPNNYDPSLVFTFLTTVVEQQNVEGLARELPALLRQKSRLDIRLNAMLCCFQSWQEICNGTKAGALLAATEAVPYVQLLWKNAFTQTNSPIWSELATCALILEEVHHRLDDGQANLFGEMLSSVPSHVVEEQRRRLHLIRKR